VRSRGFACCFFAVLHVHGAVVARSVTDVQFTGEGVSGTPVLAVNAREGELLIPLAEDI